MNLGDIMSKPLFGPGGNSDSFHLTKLATSKAPEWIKDFGLDAYEYEAGRGVPKSIESFKALGENAKKSGISLSIHAPYFISLSSVEEEKRKNSSKYILESAMALQYMGGLDVGKTIVIHAGSCAKISRDLAATYAKDALRFAIEVLHEAGLYGFDLGIETMGKVNQFGTLDEVIEMCSVDKTVVPVVDFGHMNAREMGGVFVTEDDYKRVFDKIASGVSPEADCHFSKIEYTNGGEKKHLTFADEKFGPDFEPLMKAVYSLGVTPTIICESDGTQAEDALSMKNCYEALGGK